MTGAADYRGCSRRCRVAISGSPPRSAARVCNAPGGFSDTCRKTALLYPNRQTRRGTCLQSSLRHTLTGTAVLQEPAELRVWVHGGVYELKQPLLFTAQDSGFPRKRNDRARAWPVTWAAVPGEEPVISGGRRLAGAWRQETVNARQAWVTEIPDVAAAAGASASSGRRPALCGPAAQAGVWQVERALDARFVWGAESGRYGTCRFGYAPARSAPTGATSATSRCSSSPGGSRRAPV